MTTYGLGYQPGPTLILTSTSVVVGAINVIVATEFAVLAAEAAGASGTLQPVAGVGAVLAIAILFGWLGAQNLRRLRRAYRPRFPPDCAGLRRFVTRWVN